MLVKRSSCGRPRRRWSRRSIAHTATASVWSASVRATGDAGELAARASFVVVAVASTDVRARARELGRHLDGRHLLVHAIGASAGPDDLRVSQVLGEETPVRRIGSLAGPALPA